MFRSLRMLMAALLIAGLLGCSRTAEQTAKVEPSTNEEAAKADLSAVESAVEENWNLITENYWRKQNDAADPAAYDVDGARNFGPNGGPVWGPSLEGALRFPADIEAAMLGEAAVAPAIRRFSEEPLVKQSGPVTFEELFEKQSKE